MTTSKFVNTNNVTGCTGLATIAAPVNMIAIELRQNTAVAAEDALCPPIGVLDNSYRARAQDPGL